MVGETEEGRWPRGVLGAVLVKGGAALWGGRETEWARGPLVRVPESVPRTGANSG